MAVRDRQAEWSLNSQSLTWNGIDTNIRKMLAKMVGNAKPSQFSDSISCLEYARSSGIEPLLSTSLY